MFKRFRARFRDWLYHKFLPWATRETYEREVKELRRAVEVQQQRINELESYIEGVQDVLRSRARVEIKNEVTK